MLHHDLQRLGLTENEAVVFLAALELGDASVRAIAQKAALSPPTTHLILEKLVKRGLASSVKTGETTRYAAEHPRQLERLLQQEQRRLKENETVLNSIVPELVSLYHLADSHPLVKVYLGPEGALAMDTDALRNRKRGQLVYSFTAVDVLEDYMRSVGRSTSEFAAQRSVTREPLRMIYTHKDGPRPGMNDPLLKREARFIPLRQYPFTASIVIRPRWGLRIFSFRQRRFVGFTIESRELADTMSSLFNFCWELLPSENQKAGTPPKKRSSLRRAR